MESFPGEFLTLSFHFKSKKIKQSCGILKIGGFHVGEKGSCKNGYMCHWDIKAKMDKIENNNQNTNNIFL